MKNEADYICGLTQDNWSEANGLPFPKAYPYVSKDNYLVIPLIKRVFEDLIVRCNDGIDMADDNAGYLNTSFAADNDRKGQLRINKEVQEYKEAKKVYQLLKRAITAAAKRR